MAKAVDFIVGALLLVVSFFAGPFAPLLQSAAASFFLKGLVALSATDLSNRQRGILVNTPNNQANLPVVYGTATIGIQPVDYRVDPASPDNTDLYIVGALCHGSQDGNGIDDIKEIWVDQRLGIDANHSTDVNFSLIQRIFGATLVTNWLSLVGLYKGTYTQTADPTMTTKFRNSWDSSMKGQGVAYVILKATFHENLYSAIPNVTVMVQGQHVYDPRDGTYKFSNNPALCIRDYLTSPIYGLGAAASEIDDPSFIAYANYCDTVIVVGGVTYGARYTCDGWIDTSRAPQDNLQQLASSGRAQIVYEGGVFSIFARDVQSPVAFALTPDNIIGNFNFSTPGQADAYNLARLTFVPAQGPWVQDAGRCSGAHAAGGIGDTTRNWASNQWHPSGVGAPTYHLWIVGGLGYDPTNSTGYPITANGAADITATGVPATDATSLYQITLDGSHTPQSPTGTVEYPDEGSLLDCGDWEADGVGSHANGAGCTVAQDGTQFHSGLESIKVITGAVAGSGLFVTKRDGTRVLATVGQSYKAGGWIFGTGAAIGRQVNVGIEFWTAASGGSQVATTNTTVTLVAGWQYVVVTAVAPATTVAALAHFYQVTAVGMTYWVDDVTLGVFNQFLADDQGYESMLDIALPFTRYNWMALAIGQILLRESRYGIACSVTCREEAIQLTVGDVVNLTHPTPGWVAKPFWVAGVALNENLTVDLALVEYQGAAYVLDGLTQIPLIPETNLPNPLLVSIPTGVTLTSDATTLLQTDDGTIVPRIHVVWTPSTDLFLDHIEIVARLTGTNPWTTTVKVPIYESPQEAYLAGVQEGQTWDVWIREVNILNKSSAWVQGTIAIGSNLPNNLLPHVGGKEDAVLNGIFEDGGVTAFWKPRNANDAGHFSLDTVTPFAGTGSLKLDVQATHGTFVEQALGILSPGASASRAYVRVNPGELWRFHAALKCSVNVGATAFAMFCCTLYDQNKAQIGGTPFLGLGCQTQSNTWAEFDQLITIPAGAYYMVPLCNAQWDPAWTSFSAYFDNLHIYRMKASNDLALQGAAAGAKTVALGNYGGSAAAASSPSKWVKVQADDGTTVLVPGYPL